MRLLEKLNITFDVDGNTTISKEKLLRLIATAKSERIFTEDNLFPNDCYVLVDQNSTDFYPFASEELEEWEKDGSFVKGDYLYKMNLVRKI